jgi:hypothetical protein
MKVIIVVTKGEINVNKENQIFGYTKHGPMFCLAFVFSGKSHPSGCRLA